MTPNILQREGIHLHETTKTDSYVVQAWTAKKLLSAVLDLHKRNFRILFTVVDGEEDIFLDSHGLCTLYKSNFSFPIYLKGKSWTEYSRFKWKIYRKLGRTTLICNW